MTRYMLAIDASAHSQAAINMLLKFYRPDKDQLVVLSVGDFDANNSLVLSDDVVLRMKKAILTRTEALVNETLANLEARGITNATGKVEVGDIRELILSEAAKEQIDTLVLGSRGLGAVQRMFVGSVSEHVMKYAKCSVMVVREPHATQTESKPEAATGATAVTEEPDSDALKLVSEYVF